jgi:protein-S-isoprenylcysteine O-methyltransferase Ste14
MQPKVWIAIAVQVAVFGVLLFGAAGTLRWPAAWIYLVLFFAGVVILTVFMARHDPALLAERMKWPVQKNQVSWDRVFMSILLPLFPGWMVLMGLDAARFRWSVVPLWLQIFGGMGIVFAFWVWYRTVRENTFLTCVVRIQTERGHKVISTGPYAIVRHPLYAAALLWLVCSALMLGSWWGVAASVLLGGGLVFRTVMEDRELQRELTGYSEYADRVRYRLVPGLW